MSPAIAATPAAPIASAAVPETPTAATPAVQSAATPAPVSSTPVPIETTQTGTPTGVTSGAGSTTATAPTTSGTTTPAVDAGTAVNQLVAQTKTIDSAFSTSLAQAQAAVNLLGKDAKMPTQMQDSLARLTFIGTMLDEPADPSKLPKITLPKGSNPTKVVEQAEQNFMKTVVAVANDAQTVAGEIDPSTASKDVTNTFLTTQGRITDAIYAVRFANKLVPPPQPATDAKTGSAQTSTAGTTTTAPASSTDTTTAPSSTTTAPTTTGTTTAPTTGTTTTQAAPTTGTTTAQAAPTTPVTAPAQPTASAPATTAAAPSA